jgi:hypothetical protein
MNKIPLKIMDLVPKETSFTLSTCEKPVMLCRWSLRVRAWATDKYTSPGLQKIFEEMRIQEIAELAYFMLKDKEQFKSQDEFMDAVSSMQDQLNLITALLGAVGIGEPEMKKIKNEMAADEAEEKPKEKKSQKRKKIGAKSLTP